MRYKFPNNKNLKSLSLTTGCLIGNLYFILQYVIWNFIPGIIKLNSGVENPEILLLHLKTVILLLKLENSLLIFEIVDHSCTVIVFNRAP